MGKSILLLIPLLIWGCNKTYDNVVDTSTENYQVTSIVGIKDTINLYNSPSDSLLNIKIIFTPESEVNKVQFSVFASDNSQLDSSPVEMIQDSLNQFENQFILSNRNPNGVYTIKFSASGSSEIIKQVAVSNFNFVNGQDSIPPFISNTIVDPDTVVVTQPTVLFTSVEASDSNGTSDILEVYFIVYRPDGTSNNNKVQLFDDGSCCPIPPFSEVSGDLVSGDGIYSRKIQVDQNNQKGTYRFEFQAEDRTGLLSNILNHYVLIQ